MISQDTSSEMAMAGFVTSNASTSSMQEVGSSDARTKPANNNYITAPSTKTKKLSRTWSNNKTIKQLDSSMRLAASPAVSLAFSSLSLSTIASPVSTTQGMPMMDIEPPIGYDNPSSEPAGGKEDLAIVWFRHDLRTHDHLPLIEASKSARHVLPVFIFDPKDSLLMPSTCRGDFPIQEDDAAYAQYVSAVVESLRDTLRSKYQSDLLVRYGSSVAILTDVASRLGASSIYYHLSTCASHRDIESQVVKSLQRKAKLDIFKSYSGSTVYSPTDLPCSMETFPDSCDEFQTLVKDVQVPKPANVPNSLPSPPTRLMELAGMEMGDVQLGKQDEKIQASEWIAMQKLEAFVSGSTTTIASSTQTQGRRYDTFYGRFNQDVLAGCISVRLIHHSIIHKMDKFSLKRYCAENDLILRDFHCFQELRDADRCSGKQAAVPVRAMSAAL